jgi:hypothetical protein
MVKSATTENPSVVKLDQQIASVKSTVVESAIKSTLKDSKRDLNRNEGLWILKFGKYQFKNVSLGLLPKGNGSTIFVLITKRKKVLFLYRLQNPKLVLSIRQIRIVHLFSSKRHDLFWWFSTRITASFRVIYTDDLLDTKIKAVWI